MPNHHEGNIDYEGRRFFYSGIFYILRRYLLLKIDLCCGFFCFGRGALQHVYREWPTSRFGAVQTLNPENPAPTP